MNPVITVIITSAGKNIPWKNWLREEPYIGMHRPLSSVWTLCIMILNRPWWSGIVFISNITIQGTNVFWWVWIIKLRFAEYIGSEKRLLAESVIPIHPMRRGCISVPIYLLWKTWRLICTMIGFVFSVPVMELLFPDRGGNCWDRSVTGMGIGNIVFG